MVDLNAILNAFATLFVTIDPISMAPIFLATTQGLQPADKRSIGYRACVVAFFILVLFLFAGQFILSAFGITIHAFRVAGGLLLFYTAFEMVFGSRNERKNKASQKVANEVQIANLAVFPLAIPMIAGPGAISAVILLATENSAWEWKFTLVGTIGVIVLMVLGAFFAAQAIDKYLGMTGRTILTRLLGVLLAALSVQFVMEGSHAMWSGF